MKLRSLALNIQAHSLSRLSHSGNSTKMLVTKWKFSAQNSCLKYHNQNVQRSNQRSWNCRPVQLLNYVQLLVGTLKFRIISLTHYHCAYYKKYVAFCVQITWVTVGRKYHQNYGSKSAISIRLFIFTFKSQYNKQKKNRQNNT